MATLVVLALVTHLTQVVPVAEHLVDLGVRHGTGRPPNRRPSQEAPVGELVGDVLEGHLAAGVEVEGELHERCTLFVDRDGVDLASLDVVGDIEVAQRRPPERPTVHGFLPHLVRHLGAVFRAAVLVERGQESVHELPDRRRVDGLGGGDQCDAALAEVCHDDGVVDAVSGKAAEVVDDDRVHVVLA
ncbi:hypothetical protein [uncultured Microbacterium sp.]|uniref:hypothetical protein n=1 Tax=uncultured Microbacterium sp. TaxID=191216 RepID=UPI0030F7897B